MNRFEEAVLSEDELKRITDRFADAARLLKVDELKIVHPQPPSLSYSVNPNLESTVDLNAALNAEYGLTAGSTLAMRLGDRWLAAPIDWMIIEDMRGGDFKRTSFIAIGLAKRLHEGAGAPLPPAPTRFTAVAGELSVDKEKP